MRPPDVARTSQIELRITPATLDLVKRAAEIQGQSVSDFVAAAAQEAAQRIIDDSQILRLSLDDQRTFAEAVANPSAPAAALVRSADAYRNLIKESR